jgi:hypothetical protein
MDKKTIFLVGIATFISAVGLFVSGYFIYPLLQSEKNNSVITNPSHEEQNTSNSENESSLFLTGRHYFEDTIMLISKNAPHYTLVATASRSEKDDSTYLQNSRVSYFNGNEWKRILRSDNNQTSSIQNNELIKSWTVNIDRSRVLRQNVTGELYVNKVDISFETQTLENEISVRSLPGYTKYMSESSGYMAIDGQKTEAYILYTRIYSSNASELLVYDGNIGLLTNWIAYWDKDGNFYHIDSTEVKNPTPNYQTHSIGILKNKIGAVLKTFDLNIIRNDSNPPTDYQVYLSNPINKNFKFHKINDIDKTPNNSYIWHMGNIEGEDGGIGLVEYILK